MGLLPEERRAPAAARLAEMVRSNSTRMATGFVGTRLLLPALTENGQHDLATRLFQSRDFPSWGYEVVNGATSVWERWDSYTRERGLQNPGMNSFSHYAFGAVSEWMFQSLAGIETDGAGYRRIIIRPGPAAPTGGGGPMPVDWVEAEYDSIQGQIVSKWRRQGRRFELDVTIPANTTATVYLPAAKPTGITEGGTPLAKADGVHFVRTEGDRAVLEIGSGSYRFVSER